jgi:hypothetical protein
MVDDLASPYHRGFSADESGQHVAAFPAGTSPQVALTVTTPMPGTARVGNEDPSLWRSDARVGSPNKGIPMAHSNSCLEGPLANDGIRSIERFT